MVNFIVFALFSSVFLASLRLNNAVPFGSSRDEASAGEYDFYDTQVFFFLQRGNRYIPGLLQNTRF